MDLVWFIPIYQQKKPHYPKSDSRAESSTGNGVRDGKHLTVSIMAVSFNLIVPC